MKGRKIFVLGTALAVFLMAGVVFAAYVIPGTGKGYSKAAQAQPLGTNDMAAATSSQLYPGGQGDVKIQISNPNPFAVKVTRVEGNGAVSSDKAGCTDVGSDPTKQTGVSFTPQDLTSGNVVPAKGTLSLSFNNAVDINNQSVDACQGAVFSVPVSMTANS